MRWSVSLVLRPSFVRLVTLSNGSALSRACGARLRTAIRWILHYPKGPSFGSGL